MNLWVDVFADLKRSIYFIIQQWLWIFNGLYEEKYYKYTFLDNTILYWFVLYSVSTRKNHEIVEFLLFVLLFL